MKFRPILMTTMLIAAVVGSLAVVAQPAYAQGPGGGGQPIVMNLGSFQWCSTVDYADVAAKALGISTTDLRFALASGKTLQDIATEKKVDIKTVTDAVDAAVTADIDQAVKDGLLTQEQADALKKATSATAAGNTPRPARGMRALFFIDPHNPVKPVIVSASALGMTCPDLAKELMTDKSVADVAVAKNVSIQTVVDALTKAYQDALAKDVDQGLISKAQAEAEKTHLVDRILMMISTPGGVFGFGGGRFGGRPSPVNGGPDGNGGPNNPPGRPGRPNNGGNGGSGSGNPGAPQGTPPAPAPSN